MHKPSIEELDQSFVEYLSDDWDDEGPKTQRNIQATNRAVFRSALPDSPYDTMEYDDVTDRVVYGLGIGSLSKAEMVRIAWALLDQAAVLTGQLKEEMNDALDDVGGWDLD